VKSLAKFTESTSTGRQRLIPLDAFRGLIMVLMAVDHANYFVARMHPTGEFWGIPLPEYESILAFITRLVTQPCAPGFFFLMGTGMILFFHSRQKIGWTEGKITRYFLTRGLILILLQFFIENPAWLLGPAESFSPPGGGGEVWFQFGVLFGLGLAMVIWAILMRLNSGLVVTISLAAVILTQGLTPNADKADALFSPFLRILSIPGKTGHIQVFYPILPWLGFVGFGVIFGRWVLRNAPAAYRRALFAGIGFLVLFFVIRILGSFGNFHPPQSYYWTDLLHVTKYPPSISFLTLTLGFSLVVLFVLSRLEDVISRWGRSLLVFGRTALFFYLLHLYVFAFLGLIFASRGGVGHPQMYLFWLAGLFFLYPLCLLYGNFKRKTPPDSIWRFF